MDNDAISRNAVIGLLLRIKAQASVAVLYGTISKEMEDKVIDIVDMFSEMVQNIPALDVAPVVHARWIEDGYRGIPCVCSHCGEEAQYMSIFKEQFDYDWDENLVPCGYEEIREYIKSKSCPECGARMDGEAE